MRCGVPASRGVHNHDHLTGFLTRFPFFDVFPSVLGPKVTFVKKVMKLTAAGAVQDSHLFPSRIFAVENPHQIVLAKIQKIFNLYVCIIFRLIIRLKC